MNRFGYGVFAFAAMLFTQIFYGLAYKSGVPPLAIEAGVFLVGLIMAWVSAQLITTRLLGSIRPTQLAIFLLAIISLQLVFSAVQSQFPDGNSAAITLHRETMLVQLFGILVAGPLLEEVIFRELLFRALSSRWRIAWAVQVGGTAAAFALFHAGYWGSLSVYLMFAVGIVLGAARLKSGGLALPLLLHFSMNLFVLIKAI